VSEQRDELARQVEALDRLRHEKLQRQAARQARRRAALARRPEARAELERAGAEADAADAARQATAEEWGTAIVQGALLARQPGEQEPPGRDELIAGRAHQLGLVDLDNLAERSGLLAVTDQVLADVADALWLEQHGLADD
jgi:hypothetical protein